MDFLRAACQKPEQATKLDDIEVGSYKVEKFRLLKTVHGLRLLVQTESFEAFLPPRFSDNVNTEEMVEELNNTAMIMMYTGKTGKRHDIEFVKQ